MWPFPFLLYALNDITFQFKCRKGSEQYVNTQKTIHYRKTTYHIGRKIAQEKRERTGESNKQIVKRKTVYKIFIATSREVWHEVVVQPSHHFLHHSFYALGQVLLTTFTDVFCESLVHIYLQTPWFLICFCTSAFLCWNFRDSWVDMYKDYNNPAKKDNNFQELHIDIIVSHSLRIFQESRKFQFQYKIHVTFQINVTGI